MNTTTMFTSTNNGGIRFVSFEEAAELVGCGVAEITRAVSCGRIPFRFAGAARLVDVADVENYRRMCGLAA